MLKKCLVTIALCAASASSFAGKVVVLDAQNALMRSEYAKQSFEALSNRPDFARKMSEAERTQETLTALTEDFRKKQAKMSEEKRAEHRRKTEFLQADLKLAVQEIQSEQQAVVRSVMAELQPKLETVLTQYMKQEDIDIIVPKDATLLVAPGADITDAITAELNKAR